MRSVCIAACTALAASIGLAPIAAFAKERQEVVAVSAMSQDVRVMTAKTGQEIMDHIAAAQKAMADSTDFTTALHETGKALALLRSVEHASPTARYHDAVGGLLHRHRAKQATGEDYVPVIGVLDDVKQLDGVEVEDVSKKLAGAKGKTETKIDAEADLIDASDDVGYLEIDLPVQETKTRLLRARTAEWKNDAPAANASLKEAMEHTRIWTAQLHAEAVEADATE